MALRPWRNPNLEWFEEDGRVVLDIKRTTNWRTRLMDLFFPLPREKRVVLDAIGSFVWRNLDGQATVREISQRLAQEYKLTPREAELPLYQFFKELGRRNYVAFLKEEG